MFNLREQGTAAINAVDASVLGRWENGPWASRLREVREDST